MKSQYMRMYGKDIASLGYRVLPIMPNTKKPGRYTADGWVPMTGWNDYATEPAAPGTIDIWSTWPDCGIGIACGNVVGIDIDVLDEDAAENCRRLIEIRLGPTPLVRFGKYPKLLMVYRTIAPFKKIKMGPIEALCQGQQFVAYSIHPDTGVEYQWDGTNLYDTAFHQIPAVSAEQVHTALQIAYDSLPEELQPAKVVVREIAPGDGDDAQVSPYGLTAHRDAVTDACDWIENDDLHWDDWAKIGMAIFTASEGAAWGLECFHAFSERAAKYDTRRTSAKWDEFTRSPPNRIGAGTLFEMARRGGWVPPASLSFHNGDMTQHLAEDTIDLSPRSQPVFTSIDGGLSDDEPTPASRPPALPEAYGFRVPDGTFPKKAWLDKGRGKVAQIANWMWQTALFPQPELALGNTLALFGAIFGRNYRMQRNGNRTNLLVVGVAPTGAGKEHSRSCAKRLLTAADMSHLLGGEGVASGAAVEAMLKQHPVRLSLLDEMGHVFEQITGSKAASHEKDIGKKMLQFYSSSTGVYKGTDYADTKLRPTVVIHNPIWCVYGTTTVARLGSSLQNNMANDGTLPRFMFFKADRVPQNFDADPSTPPPQDAVEFLSAAHKGIEAVIGNLAAFAPADIEPAVIEVEWTEQTFEMYKAMSLWAAALVNTRGEIWTRLMENVVKIAMIDTLTTSDLHRPVMRPESMQKALDLAVWAMGNLEDMIRDDGAENSTEAAYKKMLGIIRAKAGKDGMTGTMLAQHTRWIEKRKRQEMLESMIEAHDVVMKKTNEGKAGRPGYRIFPAAR